MLAADARLIPPRIDTTCLGIPGCVDKLHLWANHKHDAWVGQVEGVYEVLQASNSGIYQSSNEPWSRTIRQKDVLWILAQSGAASQRSTATVGDNTLEQVCGTRRFARLAKESAKVLKRANLFSKKELFAHDIQDFKRYLEESLYATIEVSGVTRVIVRDLLDEAQFFPKELADEQGRIFISPFDRRLLLAGIVACENWVIPEVNIFGVAPFDVNAVVLSLHLDRGIESNQAGGFVAKGAVMELDEEIFHLCSKELTEGMYLVSHSAICASIKNMFKEIWSILKLPLVGAETYCVYYGLKGANGVAVISGADLNFSGLRLMIAPAYVVPVYWQLTSMGIELLEVFHGSQISELDRLLASWFPP